MDTGKLNVLSNLSAPDVSTIEQNIVLNAFRIAVNGSLTQFNMVDGIIDEYEDESGIQQLSAPFAHLKCNETSGTNITDNGTGANTFTSLNNTSTMTVAGKGGALNTALEFNGTTDRIDQTALATDIASDTSGSVAFWFKTTDTSAQIWNITKNLTDFDYFEIEITGGEIRVDIHDGVTQLLVYKYNITIDDNTWRHFVVTQDGTQLRMYINGTEITTGDNLVKLTDTDPTAWMADLTLDQGTIGALMQNSSPQTWYAGQLDDIRYYSNKALTASEVAAIYNAGIGSESSEFFSSNISYDSVNDLYSPLKDTITNSPYFHFKLNETSGTVVTDSGTGGNNGTANVDISNHTVSGKINTAYEFDGTEFLNINGVEAGINSDTIGSFSFWIKPDTVAGQGNILAFAENTGLDMLRVLYQGGSNERVQLYVTNGVDQLVIYSSVGSVPDDGVTWTHCVGVQNGTQFNWYINGQEDTEVRALETKAGAWFADAPNINNGRIGCRNWNSTGNAEFLDGTVDDIRYYSGVALTLLDAQALYNSGNGTEDQNPEGLPNNMTLISNTFTAQAQPDNARIVLFEEDVDSVTLNTDLLAYASRDGGTTFSQITLVNEGLYEAGKNILAASVDISGQPAGTSMVYKIETLNNKDLKIHGTGLSWD